MPEAGTILIVEPDGHYRSVLALALARLGRRSLEASTGSDASKYTEADLAKVFLVMADLEKTTEEYKEFRRRLAEWSPSARIVSMSAKAKPENETGTPPEFPSLLLTADANEMEKRILVLLGEKKS